MAKNVESHGVIQVLKPRYVDPSSTWLTPYVSSPPRISHTAFLPSNDGTWNRGQEGAISRRHHNQYQVTIGDDWNPPVYDDFRAAQLPESPVYPMTPGNIEHLLRQYCSPGITQLMTSVLGNQWASDDADMPEGLLVEAERVHVEVNLYDDEDLGFLPLYGGSLETSVESRLSVYGRMRGGHAGDLSSDLRRDRPLTHRVRHESFFERYVETRMALSRNRGFDDELDAALVKAESVLRKCKYSRGIPPQPLGRGEHRHRLHQASHPRRHDTLASSARHVDGAMCRTSPKRPVTYENRWYSESGYNVRPTEHSVLDDDWDSDDSSAVLGRTRPGFMPDDDLLGELYDSPYKLRRLHYNADSTPSLSSKTRFGTHNSDKMDTHLPSRRVDLYKDRAYANRFLGDGPGVSQDFSGTGSFQRRRHGNCYSHGMEDKGHRSSSREVSTTAATLRGHSKSVRFTNGHMRYGDDGSDCEYGDDEENDDDNRQSAPIKKLPTIVQPRRWVGWGFLSDPVEFHTDRGYLLWVCPRGKLRVHFYYGHNGDDFTCFVDPQYGGVSVYHVIRETPRLIVSGRENPRLSGSLYHVRRSPCRHAYENWFRVLSKRGTVTLELKAIRGFPTAHRAFKINFTIVPR